MAKPARKPAPDEIAEVCRSAAPGASEAHLVEMLQTLKRREPGALPPPLTLAHKPAEEPESAKDVVRSAVIKAQEQEASARTSRARLRAPKSRTSRIALATASLLTAGMAAHLYLSGPTPIARTDYSPDVADILPITELHDHGGDWTGVVDASWASVNNAAVAMEACEEVRVRVLVSGSLDLYTTAGRKLVTCGL